MRVENGSVSIYRKNKRRCLELHMTCAGYGFSPSQVILLEFF